MTDTTTDNVSLNLDDVETAIWSIDYAADQGAYKGWESTAKAFAVRERMVRFLNLARQNQQQAAAAAAAAQAAANPAPVADEATTVTATPTDATPATPASAQG